MSFNGGLRAHPHLITDHFSIRCRREMRKLIFTRCPRRCRIPCRPLLVLGRSSESLIKRIAFMRGLGENSSQHTNGLASTERSLFHTSSFRNNGVIKTAARREQTRTRLFLHLFCQQLFSFYTAICVQRKQAELLRLARPDSSGNIANCQLFSN